MPMLSPARATARSASCSFQTAVGYHYVIGGQLHPQPLAAPDDLFAKQRGARRQGIGANHLRLVSQHVVGHPRQTLAGIELRASRAGQGQINVVRTLLGSENLGDEIVRRLTGDIAGRTAQRVLHLRQGAAHIET